MMHNLQCHVMLFCHATKKTLEDHKRSLSHFFFYEGTESNEPLFIPKTNMGSQENTNAVFFVYSEIVPTKRAFSLVSG